MQYKKPTPLLAVLYLLLSYSTTISAQLTPVQVTNLPTGYYVQPSFPLNNEYNLLTNFDSAFYFTAINGNDVYGGGEIYKYDGNSIIQMSIPINSYKITRIIGIYNSKLYFTAVDTNYNSEVYAYDGTTSTPTGIKDISMAKIYNGNIVLTATTDANGQGFYTYDGNTLTLVTSGLIGGFENRNSVILNNSFYFVANNRLYKYDGITTARIDSSINGGPNANPNMLETYNNKLYFSGLIRNNFQFYFWEYDGISVDSISIAPGVYSPQRLFVYNNNLYFSTNSTGHTNEIYKYDGSTVSLELSVGLNERFTYANQEQALFTIFNNDFYFTTTELNQVNKLWKYNGNTPPSVVKTLSQGISVNTSLFEYNNNLYFQAYDSITGHELYKYDGVSTSLVRDINSGSAGSFPNNYQIVNGELYFIAVTNLTPITTNIYKLSNNTNITKLAPQQDLKVFPNPTTGLVTLQTTATVEHIQILNLEGKVVLTPSLDNINISSLATGVYILHATTDKGSMYQKVVKK